MKKQLAALTLLLFTSLCQAQTKIFREISNQISSQVQAIMQDNNLVGYLVFTQLEKASQDSFNYKIVIMDENLNDIGSIPFRDQKLELHSVAFEQDVLCLSYLKRSTIRTETLNKKGRAIPHSKVQPSVFLQFLNLDGKIVNTVNYDVELAAPSLYYEQPQLRHYIQVKNVPQKGFACFYGENKKNILLHFNAAGKLVWKKNADKANSYQLHTSGSDIYLLEKQRDRYEQGGWELVGYNPADSSVYPKFVVKDKQGNSLRIINISNDPANGKLYMAGYIIDQRKKNKFNTIKRLARGIYAGVFTININGPKKADIQEIYTYWNDGSQPFLAENGKQLDSKCYLLMEGASKDFDGNTIFSGYAIKRKPKWGNIIFTTVTLPTLVLPLYSCQLGYTKGIIRDNVFMKQTSKGVLSIDQQIPGNKMTIVSARFPIEPFDAREYYHVANAQTKSSYVIIDDVNDIFIYNVTQKKVVRTIHHKEGSSRINVYPAKEGSILVSEYNQKEKYTRVSIEAL